MVRYEVDTPPNNEGVSIQAFNVDHDVETLYVEPSSLSIQEQARSTLH